MLAHVRASNATTEEAAASNLTRMDASVLRVRTECEENVARQAAETEEKRGFFEVCCMGRVGLFVHECVCLCLCVCIHMFPCVVVWVTALCKI